MINDADWAYRQMMALRRRRIRRQSGSLPIRLLRGLGIAAETAFVAIPTGYGTQPVRFAVSVLALVMACALAYWLLGPQLIYSAGGDPTLDLFQAVYFSVCTFTTLGYGDWAPSPGSVVQWLATAEAFAGFVLGALFVVVVARKLVR